MKNVLIFLLLLLFLAPEAKAGISIFEPEDKLITFNEVIMLRGRGRKLDVLKVNEEEIKFNLDGSFSCGLVLKGGKNYVEVRAQDEDKNHFIKKIRILRLKTYPDMESLYDGKKHWARTQIIYLSSLGYIEGYPDNNFYPGNPITRGELATWIARVKRLIIPTLTEDVFFDVPKEHWRAPYVKAVVDAGFMSSYTKEIFGIDDPISRREAAQIAVVTEGLGVVEKIKPLFIDVPREEKGAVPIYIAGEKGLVKGIYEDIPVYDPDRALTRAEAALLLARFGRSVSSVRYLFDFEKGYSEINYCKLNVPPEIVSFTAQPDRIRLGERSTVRLEVKIAARKEFSSISTVKVDLSEAGGMPDTEMFDDGTHGDEFKNDNIYSLSLSLEPKVGGTKIMMATAIDQLGWESERQTSLLILE